jgi:hypothetical protein
MNEPPNRVAKYLAEMERRRAAAHPPHLAYVGVEIVMPYPVDTGGPAGWILFQAGDRPTLKRELADVLVQAGAGVIIP